MSVPGRTCPSQEESSTGWSLRWEHAWLAALREGAAAGHELEGDCVGLGLGLGLGLD